MLVDLIWYVYYYSISLFDKVHIYIYVDIYAMGTWGEFESRSFMLLLI